MVIDDEQIVSVHTFSGVPLYQFLTNHYSKLKWTRALREVSTCDLNAPPRAVRTRIPDITPWLHWVSVWDGQGRDLYWRGPIQRVEQGRDWISLAAFDAAALLARTRCPLTKRWEAEDPSVIAAALWAAAIDHHGLNVQTIERLDPRGDRFDFACVADEKTVDEVNNELVDLGLYWSVVAGVPILGPASFNAVTALGEQHFEDGELTVIRDGANTYNDILLRTGDHVSRASTPMGGLSLQAIVTRDSLSGVSNADRAAYQAVRYSGAIRDAISISSGATLRPNAPISIKQLIPSVRINIEAFGMLSTQELEGVTVTRDQSGTTVGIDLESVNDELPELLEPVRPQR